jgi:hypothetical protein
MQESRQEVLSKAPQGRKICPSRDYHGSVAKRRCRHARAHAQGRTSAHRYLNTWAENSHQPTRQRERRMQGFKSPGHAQRFVSACGPSASHFHPRRHRLSAPVYRQEMDQRFQGWREITALAAAASALIRRPLSTCRSGQARKHINLTTPLPRRLPWCGQTVGLMLALSRNIFVGS